MRQGLSFYRFSGESTELMDAEKISSSKLQTLDGVTYLPHWVQYIAWTLCLFCIFVAGFFTLLYGLSFGKNDQEKWLFAFFVSVFSDICINQPIKVTNTFFINESLDSLITLIVLHLSFKLGPEISTFLGISEILASLLPKLSLVFL